MLKKMAVLSLIVGAAFAALMLTSRNADFAREDFLQMEHSAATVWNVLIDAQNWPLWWPGMERVILDGEMKEGARLDLYLSGIPGGEPARVTMVSPHEELIWERDGILGSLTRTRLRLTEAQDSTTVAIQSHIVGPQAVLARYARRDDFARYHEIVLRSLNLHLERSVARERESVNAR